MSSEGCARTLFEQFFPNSVCKLQKMKRKKMEMEGQEQTHKHRNNQSTSKNEHTLEERKRVLMRI